MKVELLHHTSLNIADIAISKCWDKSVTEDKMCERMERVANKNKHASTIEHLVYSFDINGISRACLQELARHRIASYSVKSTRYTLKELKKEKSFAAMYNSDIKNTDEFKRASKYLVFPSDNVMIIHSLLLTIDYLRGVIKDGIDNDVAKYCLPEAYKTSLVMTINARSLQNFLALRSSKDALWEIRDLANAMYKTIPNSHKFLFEEFLKCYI
jgi:thymidylate synthase (FAD)